MEDNLKNPDEQGINPKPTKALAEHKTAVLSPYGRQPESDLRDEEESINLLELWRVLVKRKWTVITFFVIVVISVVTATFLQTPIYRASLTLQIEREPAKVVEYDSVTPVESSSAQDFYQTQYELLRSRSLAERVIDRLNLAENPVFTGGEGRSLRQRLTAWIPQAGNEATAEPSEVSANLAERFLANLTIEPVRNSRLVRIHYDSPDPRLTAHIVNALAEAYINLNLERRFDASSYARTFLEERLQQIKVRLEDSERELVDFARQEQIVNIDDRQTINTQNLQAINSALSEAERNRIQAETLYRQTQGHRGQGLSQILESPVVQQLKEIKARLEAEYQDRLMIYKPAYPRMLQLAGQIAKVQAQIDEEVNNVHFAIHADYEIAKVQEALLATKLEETKNEVMALQNRSIQYNILSREVDTNRQLYEGLLQRYKEIGVAGGVGTNNISIVDNAKVPVDRFKPSLSKNALLAIFLGLLGGVGLVFLFEHVDDSLKQPEDLERLLGLPVLGIIPIAKVPRGHKDAPLALLAHDDLRSAFAEAYRSVRTALQFCTAQGVPRVLTVTSSASAEGKSTTALSLAIQFAQMGKKVLLIDADLRKPSLHRNLNLGNGLGLTNYLAENAKPVNIAKPTPIPNLFAVCSGPLPPNPVELLSSAKMVSFLSLAAEKFDQVILDAPPVLGIADAVILGNLAEGTVLVVEAGGTRRGHAQGALKRLTTARSRVLGSILTKLDARSSAYGYNQAYYYYSEIPSSERRLSARA